MPTERVFNGQMPNSTAVKVSVLLSQRVPIKMCIIYIYNVIGAIVEEVEGGR